MNNNQEGNSPQLDNNTNIENENVISTMEPSQPLANKSNNTIAKKSKNIIVKILAIIGGIVVFFIIFIIIMISITSATSDKLVCKSSEGNITIMYNDSKINGYKSNGITYDLDQQNTIANQIGIESYISEFTTWFETNTSGSCTVEKK